MIVCLVRNTETIAGWILDVPHGRMAVAHKGEGVAVDGLPIAGKQVARAPCGMVGYKVRKELDRQLTAGQRQRLGKLSTLRCAGAEYVGILSGRMDFASIERSNLGIMRPAP